MIDVTLLTEGLYVGAYHPDLLRTYGGVLMCARLRDDERSEVEALGLAARLHEFAFTDDIYEPTAKELAVIDLAVYFGIMWITGLSAKRYDALGPLVITCREGRNRSCLVAGLILSRVNPAFTGPELVAYIQGLRPGSLYNPYFKNILLNPTIASKP